MLTRHVHLNPVRAGLTERPADVCDPTPGRQEYVSGNNAHFDLAADTPLNTDCVANCIKSYYIDPANPRASIRMFHDADVNKDGKVNIYDLAEMKPYYKKGFGPHYREGYKKVDYDNDGWVSALDLARRTDGQTRCDYLMGQTTFTCTVCDDDGTEGPYFDCLNLH